MLWWPGQPVIMLSHGVELSLYHLAEKTFCLFGNGMFSAADLIQFAIH